MLYSYPCLKDIANVGYSLSTIIIIFDGNHFYVEEMPVLTSILCKR